jgi:hypothetical protein
MEYRIIFIITCAVGLAGMTFYLFFASADLQPWAVVDESDEMEKNGSAIEEKENGEKSEKNKF